MEYVHIAEVKITERYGKKMNKREEVLRQANEMVNGHREADYGTPESNFKNIADVWSWYLDTELSPLDVANLMTLMKMARIKGNTFKADSYIDAIGYLACGYEIADCTSKVNGDVKLP